MPRPQIAVTPRFERCLASVVSAVLAALLAVFLCAPVSAQEIDSRALLQRIERLESDLAILQRQVYVSGSTAAPARAGAPSGPLAPTVAAGLEVRVSQLENEMQTMTGRLEEIGHNVDQVRAQFEKLAKDVDFRLSAAERGGEATPAPTSQPESAPPSRPAAAAPSAAATPSAAEPPPPPQKAVLGSGQVLPVGAPQQQYDWARGLLIQQNYADAERAFAAFVNTHPDDPLAGAAQYWLGETFYLRANYDQAARAFAEGYQKYPKGTKAPDTLLKLGMSLVQLNRKKDACVLFTELDQRYPGAPTNVKQAVQRERQRAGCG